MRVIHTVCVVHSFLRSLIFVCGETLTPASHDLVRELPSSTPQAARRQRSPGAGLAVSGLPAPARRKVASKVAEHRQATRGKARREPLATVNGERGLQETPGGKAGQIFARAGIESVRVDRHAGCGGDVLG